MIWFLRLFKSFRDLEAQHMNLRLLHEFDFPPTALGVCQAMGTAARAVLPAAIMAEVKHEQVPGVPRGVVRIIVQENSDAP